VASSAASPHSVVSHHSKHRVAKTQLRSLLVSFLDNLFHLSHHGLIDRRRLMRLQNVVHFFFAPLFLGFFCPHSPNFHNWTDTSALEPRDPSQNVPWYDHLSGAVPQDLLDRSLPGRDDPQLPGFPCQDARVSDSALEPPHADSANCRTRENMLTMEPPSDVIFSPVM